MKETNPREMIETLSYKRLGSEKSVFGLDHWGGKKEACWLQPDFQHDLVDRFIHSKVRGYQTRLLEAMIDLLIERGFFKKPRSVEDVSLAVEIINQFVNLEAFQKAYNESNLNHVSLYKPLR